METELHLRHKLNVKQVRALTLPGIYSDGGGLYLRVRLTGTRAWVYVQMMRGKRRELGLGPLYDVTLADARQQAFDARQAFRTGRDPIAERAEAAKPRVPIPSFGAFAEILIADIEAGFRNDKHRKQWRSTLIMHAAALTNIPISAIETEDVLAVLQPIWLKLPETASRVRGRIERVLDAAQ